MAQRCNELTNTERETRCKGCNSTIERGRLRYWDNHKDVNGVICVPCFSKIGPVELNADDRAPQTTKISEKDVEQLKKDVSAIKGHLDLVLTELASIKAMLASEAM